MLSPGPGVSRFTGYNPITLRVSLRVRVFVCISVSAGAGVFGGFDSDQRYVLHIGSIDKYCIDLLPGITRKL